jgi:hypothetical protein
MMPGGPRQRLRDLQAALPELIATGAYTVTVPGRTGEPDAVAVVHLSGDVVLRLRAEGVGRAALARDLAAAMEERLRDLRRIGALTGLLRRLIPISLGGLGLTHVASQAASLEGPEGLRALLLTAWPGLLSLSLGLVLPSLGRAAARRWLRRAVRRLLDEGDQASVLRDPTSALER